jgi:S-adenosylmethionine uptake transporter
VAIHKTNLNGALMSLAAFGLYATHDAIVKFLGTNYSPFQIIFFSVLLGFPFVTLMLMRDRTDGNLRPRQPLWVWIRTIAAVVNVVAGFYAFSVLPLAQAYAVFFAMPLMITLMAIPLLGEKVGLRRGIAVLVGLLGVIVVLRPGQVPLGLGQLAALVAATTGALVSVIVRKIGREERSAVLMLYPMMANFVATGAMMPFVYRPMPIDHFGLLVLMSFLAFAAAMLVIQAYRIAPAVIVAPMQYSQIVWAVLYGWLFFAESLDLLTAAGTAIIIASGVYIVLREGGGKVETSQPVSLSRVRPETGLLPRINTLLARSPRDPGSQP